MNATTKEARQPFDVIPHHSDMGLDEYDQKLVAEMDEVRQNYAPNTREKADDLHVVHVRPDVGAVAGADAAVPSAGC